jgi:hypothetical protein
MGLARKTKVCCRLPTSLERNERFDNQTKQKVRRQKLQRCASRQIPTMMHYRPRTMAISAVVVVATLGFFPHSTTAQGLFSSLFQSRCTERCGFLGLSVVMRDGTPGSEDCWESCVFTSLLRPSSMVCGSCSTSSFDIGLDFIGIPPSDQAFFLDAKARWETIITGDVADRRSTRMRSGIPGCRFPLSIDDIRVCAL